MKMTVRAISRLAGSGRKDAGALPAAEIEPPAEWRSEPMSASIPPCAYCGAQLPLKESHILPRWLIERALSKSSTGRMRDADQINVPVQDGEKRPLLCESCEQRFSKLETIEATRYDQGKTAPGDAYNGAFCKFLVSVVWRVGTGRLEETKAKHPQFLPSLVSALQTWKDYLDGKRSDLGTHPVAFLVLDADLAKNVFNYMNVERPGKGAAPVLHRYFVNSVNTELAVYEQDGYALAWAMCGSWLIVGVIELPTAAQSFSSIEILPGGGSFPVGNVNVPDIVLMTLGSQSWVYLDKRKAISPRQRKKTHAYAATRASQFNDASQQQATAADQAMFGDAANVYVAPIP